MQDKGRCESIDYIKGSLITDLLGEGGKMQNLMENLVKALKQDERVLTKDGLLKNKLTELALKLDQVLLSHLLSDKKLREAFFVETDAKKEKLLVFDSNKFISFINNKEFLPDSFTAFKNRIGLMSNGEYIKEKGDVVLAWAYKDCILEGGQDKEDQKRDEIFYNEVLAPDEIDRLFEEKVFTNFKRIDSKGEHKLDRFDDSDNLIIKGNNLLALHCLKQKFRGQVKLIYIDPPYNTGNDSFHYNDKFNHSTWLTFTKNRLEIAYELLRDDGVIFVQCDDHEQAHLKVLMDEIFKRDNFITTMTIVNDARVRNYEALAKTHEFVCVYAKTALYELYQTVNESKEFAYSDEEGDFDIYELRNRNIQFNSQNRPNLFYPFYLNPNKKDKNGFYEVGLQNKKGWIEVLPLKSQGVQTVWRWGKETAEKHLNTILFGKESSSGYQIVKKYRGKTRPFSSVWHDKEIKTDRGTLEIKALFNNKRVFDFPKPEAYMQRIIEMSTKPNDIILDYHIGSGTTCAVAHKLGRKYIGIEQMDYVEKITVERLKKVIHGEHGGISKKVNWKGGGSFVYMELMELSEAYIRDIKKAETTKVLLGIYEKMKKEASFRYEVDLSKFDEKEFGKLSLKDQKQVLLGCLDKNHLYVNYSEIDDTTYKVSTEDKKLNREFYGF